LVKTYSQLYLDARRTILLVDDSQSAAMVARQLLCFVSGKTQEQILADRDLYASEDISAKLDFAVSRYVKGEPLAYILGEWEFYGLPLYVTKDVLIPRDDTCAVTTLAIDQAMRLESTPRILDLCTGSGCIGLAIASRVKDARVTLADISREALAVAKRNIQRNHLTSKVTCIQANALEKPSHVLGKFDLIVSNPPYITAEEMKELPHSVDGFEPHLALYGGEDGLDYYRRIAKSGPKYLQKGGMIILEVGDGQASDVARLFTDAEYTIIIKDMMGKDRFVKAIY
jgi:release factor glutamine methyltransferase